MPSSKHLKGCPAGFSMALTMHGSQKEWPQLGSTRGFRASVNFWRQCLQTGCSIAIRETAPFKFKGIGRVAIYSGVPAV